MTVASAAALIVAVVALAVSHVAVIGIAAWVVWRVAPYAVPVLRFVQTARPVELARVEREQGRAVAREPDAPPATPVAPAPPSPAEVDAASARVSTIRARGKQIEAMPDGSEKEAAASAFMADSADLPSLLDVLKRAGMMP